MLKLPGVPPGLLIKDCLPPNAGKRRWPLINDMRLGSTQFSSSYALFFLLSEGFWLEHMSRFGWFVPLVGERPRKKKEKGRRMKKKKLNGNIGRLGRESPRKFFFVWWFLVLMTRGLKKPARDSAGSYWARRNQYGVGWWGW